jgi:hypothetical protein
MSETLRCHYELSLPKAAPGRPKPAASLAIWIHDSEGKTHRRYALPGEPIRLAMLRIGHAITESLVTDRPAFREVADQLLWSEIR